MLKFLFWYFALSTLINIITACKDHPRKSEINLGTDIVGLLLTASIAVWIATSIWGGK